MAIYTRGEETAWRALAEGAKDPGVSPAVLLSRVKTTAGRAIPCDRRRNHGAFVALKPLARAYADAPLARRGVSLGAFRIWRGIAPSLRVGARVPLNRLRVRRAASAARGTFSIVSPWLSRDQAYGPESP